MDTNILAVIIQEGTKLASEYLRNRAPSAVKESPVDLEKFIMDSEQRFKPLISSEKEVKEEVPQSQKAVININAAPREELPPLALEPGKATTIATGCVPCAMGHFGTCSGILNESLRFAHSPDGLNSPEVIDRVNMCMDELNAMERVDLRPEMTVQLTGWEKELADKALSESRGIRHKLEGITNVEDLEQAAAKTQSSRKEIGRAWFKNKLSNLSPDDQEEIKRRVMAKIEEMANAEA